MGVKLVGSITKAPKAGIGIAKAGWGAVKNALKPKKVSDTITNLKGEYNIGSANKIKNKASAARIKNMSFNIKQTAKKLGDTMDKLGKK